MIEIIKQLCYILSIILQDIVKHGNVLEATVQEAITIHGNAQFILDNHGSKPTAHLDNWVLSGSMLCGYDLDYGNIDPVKVLNIDFEHGTAETINTRYTLGKPKEYSVNDILPDTRLQDLPDDIHRDDNGDWYKE